MQYVYIIIDQIIVFHFFKFHSFFENRPIFFSSLNGGWTNVTRVPNVSLKNKKKKKEKNLECSSRWTNSATRWHQLQRRITFHVVTFVYRLASLLYGHALWLGSVPVESSNSRRQVKRNCGFHNEEHDLGKHHFSDSQPLLSVVMDVTKYSVHTTRNWQIEPLYHRDPPARTLIMHLWYEQSRYETREDDDLSLCAWQSC